MPDRARRFRPGIGRFQVALDHGARPAMIEWLQQLGFRLRRSPSALISRATPIETISADAENERCIACAEERVQAGLSLEEKGFVRDAEAKYLEALNVYPL